MKNKNLYTVWKNMRQRCLNNNKPNYKHYGGRGITICKKWDTYDGFLDDMGDSYKSGLTLDRINNNKNYKKSNCRWVTMKVQNNNKSWNKNITFNGTTKNVTEWANHLNINKATLWSRLFKHHWSVEKSFTKKVRSWL